IIRELFLKDFKDDLKKILPELTFDSFREDRTQIVKSEKTGINYIFILVCPVESMIQKKFQSAIRDIRTHENYTYCCEKIAGFINSMDVKNVLIHPFFNKNDFNPIDGNDSDFLTNTLKSTIDRFTHKNIYIYVFQTCRL
ncbi:MAG: hypothetical protein HDT23_06385, partial [Ruminococcus sp.]|nr:hypothetical protein [Ruminococcus sp.]